VAHIPRLLDDQSSTVKETYLEKSNQWEARQQKACLLKFIGHPKRRSYFTAASLLIFLET